MSDWPDLLSEDTEHVYARFLAARDEWVPRIPCIPKADGGRGAPGLEPGDWSDDNSMNRLAKKQCEDVCPIVDVCLEYALSRPERFGVWGGKDAKQRRAILRSRERESLVEAQGGLPLAGLGTEELNGRNGSAAHSAADGREREAREGRLYHPFG